LPTRKAVTASATLAKKRVNNKTFFNSFIFFLNESLITF